MVPARFQRGPGHDLGFDFYPLEPKQYVSIVLSHPICGNLLWQPYETNILSKTV